MSKIEKLFALCLGIIIYPFQKILSTSKDIVIFGGGNGNYYAENSKYLYEYYLANSTKQVYWVTRKYSVYKRLKDDKKPVLYNYNLLACFKILKAHKVVFCTSRADILFVHKQSDKIIINLFHGMPLKKIIYDYDGEDQKRGHFFDQIWNTFVVGFNWEEVNITLSTSDFFSSILKSSFRNKNIFVTGLPRNDYLFSDLSIEDRKFEQIVGEKKIISYLPTHRKFGTAEQAQVPFKKDPQFQEYLESHETILVHKPHYNVVGSKLYETNSIKEFYPGSIDAQEMLKHSEILITDYSSCYIDFLLIDKPIIFYRYDNYESEDTGLYEEVEKFTTKIGPTCETESELKESISKILSGKDDYAQSRLKVKNIFHEFITPGFSKRVYELLEYKYE